MCKYIYENFTQRPLKIVCVGVCMGFCKEKKLKGKQEERKDEERERDVQNGFAVLLNFG